MRHRVGWSYNETSGRYKELEPVFYMPDRKRNLVQQGKPGEYEFVPGTIEQGLAVEHSFSVIYRAAYSHYQQLIKAGIAREVARDILPVGLFTSFYATCNPRSLMHFLSLRTKSEDSTFKSFPLREIEQVAERMEAEFQKHFPLTHAAFVANGRVAP
jgi:thymidylate synthase (FAD)